jgi:hypothetical protein
MTVYLFCNHEDRGVQVILPIVSEDGRTRGKGVDIIRPGDDFFGHTYEDLIRLGDGEHEIEPKDPAPKR